MGGGAPRTFNQQMQRKPVKKPRQKAASGWDDEAAAKSEVFGDGKDDQDPSYEGPYQHRGAQQNSSQ